MSSLPRSELLRQLAQISLCQVYDASASSLTLETEIRPLDLSFRICAPALTVLCHPNDNLTLHHALHLAYPGQVLVVSGSGATAAALWGELMSISAQARGLAGTIADGAVRDPVEIAALGYPVFSRAISPRRAAKQAYGNIGEPIACGSLTIRTGDIVVADCHGILAFPESELAAVLQQAQAIAQKESELKPKLRAGESIFDLGGFSSLVPARCRDVGERR